MAGTTVGLRELKTQLARYVRRVKSGDTIIITERGKPIAQIISVKPSLEDKMQKMIDEGLAAWSGRKLKVTPPRVRTRGKRTMSDIVIENRE